MPSANRVANIYNRLIMRCEPHVFCL